MPSTDLRKRPVALTILDSDGLTRADIEHTLREEGFAPQQLPSQDQSSSLLVNKPVAAVLIFRQFNEDRIDKALEQSRDFLTAQGGDAKQIICCSEGLPRNDIKKLRRWGAAKVIHPEFWNEPAVANRISAALFGGFKTDLNDLEYNDGEKPYMECWVPFRAKMAKRRIVGATRVMRELFADIELYSDVPAPILIVGETGTGKELVAAAIHSPNQRSKLRYITINIAEISPELLPNELFGHSRDAFTDARAERVGLFAEARDGTVFIDEIGALDEKNQAKLLRVFSNQEMRPVGAEHEKRVALEARLIFATHEGLEEKCARNTFRHDLYRRITEGHTIHLRALRDRKGDLELLTKEFFNEWHQEHCKHTGIFAMQQSDYDAIVDLCFKHDFPGNVRSLRGILRSSFTFSLRDNGFKIDHLERELDVDRKMNENSQTKEKSPGSDMPSITFDPKNDCFDDFLAGARTVYYSEVFRAAGGRVDLAIEIAKKGEKTFYKYCTKQIREKVLKSIKNRNSSDS